MTSVAHKQIFAQIEGVGDMEFRDRTTRAARFLCTFGGDNRRAIIHFCEPRGSETHYTRVVILMRGEEQKSLCILAHGDLLCLFLRGPCETLSLTILHIKLLCQLSCAHKVCSGQQFQ